MTMPAKALALVLCLSACSESAQTTIMGTPKLAGDWTCVAQRDGYEHTLSVHFGEDEKYTFEEVAKKGAEIPLRSMTRGNWRLTGNDLWMTTESGENVGAIPGGESFNPEVRGLKIGADTLGGLTSLCTLKREAR